MVLQDFALRLAVALALGAMIGVERQWRQRMAGLRTAALVSTGSALFVTMSLSMADTSAAGRIAAQVVSGIGFLGAGVILRDGLNVRGLNTAATLWCAAAVGTLAGYGLLVEGAIGSVMVLGANILLRPIARKINAAPDAREPECRFRVRLLCRRVDEAPMRLLLLQHMRGGALALLALHSEDLPNTDRVSIEAELRSTLRNVEAVESIVARLSMEPTVQAISWELEEESEKQSKETPISKLVSAA
ncbi:MAG: MgtC/SapB family protein [Bryobacteraceae bacterium]